jgi:hypothetical protein
LKRQKELGPVTINPGIIVKRSMYDSDNNGGEMNSTSTSSNVPIIKKLMTDKTDEKRLQQKKTGISSGVTKR